MTAPQYLAPTVRSILSRRYTAAKTTRTGVIGSGFDVAHDSRSVLVRDEVPARATGTRSAEKSRERLDAYADTLRDAGLTVRRDGPLLAVTGTVSEKTRIGLKRD